MRKIYLILCTTLIMFSAVACGKSNEAKPVEFDKEALTTNAIAFAESIATAENLSQIVEEDIYEEFANTYGDDIAASYKSFYDTTKDIGDYISTTVTDTTNTDETISFELSLKYEQEVVVLKCNFDKRSNMVNFSTELYNTLGQKMLKALLNTVMGMGAVYLVLIFISFIIALLKYVPKLFAKKEVIAPISNVEPVKILEEELVDDSEMVAVITAAIMASLGENAPKDGLVVRSIRKVNSKWKNA